MIILAMAIGVVFCSVPLSVLLVPFIPFRRLRPKFIAANDNFKVPLYQPIKALDRPFNFDSRVLIADEHVDAGLVSMSAATNR